VGIKIPQVTEGQIVAAMLRGIATQLIKLAEKLDVEAAANRPKDPKPARKPKRVETSRERLKRMGVL